MGLKMQKPPGQKPEFPVAGRTAKVSGWFDKLSKIFCEPLATGKKNGFELREAVRRWDQLSRTFPNEGEPLHMRGREQAKLKGWDAAIESYREALGTDYGKDRRKQGEIYYDLACAYEGKGDLAVRASKGEGARELYEDALRKLGISRMKTGDAAKLRSRLHRNLRRAGYSRTALELLEETGLRKSNTITVGSSH